MTLRIEYPTATVATPAGLELNGIDYPDSGCTQWACHKPARWAFSIMFFTHEQVTWGHRHPDATQGTVKGYDLRPRYCVYQNSKGKGDFKTMAAALDHIDTLNGVTTS